MTLDFKSLLRKAKSRKAKRVAKRRTLYAGKPSLPGRAIARGKLDSLWAVFVKLRDRRLHGPMCRICGVRAGEVAYHVVPKQRGDAIRWLPENGVLACSACNYGEMVRRADYRDKHIRLFGKSMIDGLEENARRGAKFSRAELASMADELRRSIERIGLNNATRANSDGCKQGEANIAGHGEAESGKASKEPGIPMADLGAGESPDILHEGEDAPGTGGDS